MKSFELSEFFLPILAEKWDTKQRISVELLLNRIQNKIDELTGEYAEILREKHKVRLQHTVRLFENLFLRHDNLDNWKEFLEKEERRKRSETQAVSELFLQWIKAPEKSPAELAIQHGRSAISGSSKFKEFQLGDDDFAYIKEHLQKSALRELFARVIWRLRNE
jgi:hypothetical protein